MTDRENFENYYVSTYSNTYLEWDDTDGYVFAETDVLWRCWQEQQKKIDRLIEKLEALQNS